MFSKLLVVSALLFSHAYAHSAIATSKATLATIQRSDVTKANSVNSCPNFKGPAGSPAVIQNGSVALFAQSFNGGTDGSLQYKAAVSTAADPTTFTPVTLSTNGPNSPPGSQEADLAVTIPASVDCTKGCTVALQSGGNFGNCVQIVDNSAAAAAGTTAAAADTTAAAADTTTAAAADSTAAAADTTTAAAAAGTTTTKKGKGRKHKGAKAAGANAAAAGTNTAAAGAKKGTKAAGAKAKKGRTARAHARDFEGELA